jgi:hypothetical protein
MAAKVFIPKDRNKGGYPPVPTSKHKNPEKILPTNHFRKYLFSSETKANLTPRNNGRSVPGNLQNL